MDGWLVKIALSPSAPDGTQMAAVLFPLPPQ